MFWVNLALNNIKNPFKQWKLSQATLLQQNEREFNIKVFQFGNTSPYIPTRDSYFNPDEIDSYSGVSLAGIQQDDLISFETGSGSFELRCYGAGSVNSTSTCGSPHFGQSIIPDNFFNRNNIVQISCGKNFTACLDDLGYIWAWGEDIGLENSGFIVNGSLYKSRSGAYKHIHSGNSRIIAVNYYDTTECFGTCYDFTYTGQTGISKTSWMSGATLGGVAIKTDNSIKIFGPFVPTTTGITYFSDISCADSYCLGVVTGPVSSGTVIGFGPTGCFGFNFSGFQNIIKTKSGKEHGVIS